MNSMTSDNQISTGKNFSDVFDKIICVVLHYPSTSWQDKIIIRMMPKDMRRDYLHVSLGIGNEYYTWTARGLEVLDIESSDIYRILWFPVPDTMPYLMRAFEMCQRKTTLKSLLLARLGFKSDTCASLVANAVWGEGCYLPYPSQVVDAITEEGIWY